MPIDYSYSCFLHDCFLFMSTVFSKKIVLESKLLIEIRI